MKHLSLFFIYILFLCQATAQTGPVTAYEKEVDEQAQLIKKYFNTKQIDSLYALMAPSFKSKVSRQVLEQGLVSQLAPYGAITQFDFERSTKGINKYKTKMLAGLTLQTLVGLDSTGLVETFAMQPYKDDAAPKRITLYNDNPMRTKMDSIADRAARSYISDSATAGVSIAIHWKGKDYFYNYGEADRSNNVKVNSNTVYEIGSITKTFVGYLLAKAVAEKKLTLNDPITKYLPDSVAVNEALQIIKIVDLANHTSGLPRLPVDLFSSKGIDQNDPYNHYNDDMLFNGLKQIKPNRKPGEQYEYSNYAMGILGTILGRIYKMPFTQLVETYIAKPMQLKQTTAANTILPGQAIGYDEKMQTKPYWNFQSLAPAGSIKSNAIDLLNYGKANAILMAGNSTMAKLLTTPTYNNPPSVVSLSWQMSPVTEKLAVLEHGGGTYGFRSHLAICPEQQWVVVALANQAVDPGASKVAVMITQEFKKLNEN